MRFLAALRGRERSYSSLTQLAPLTDPANHSTPTRVVERIAVSERPELASSETEIISIGDDPDGTQSDPTKSLRTDIEYQLESSEQKVIDFNATLANLQVFQSYPRPPPYLWDTDDVQYLDKVMCHCRVRLTYVDPKNGSFEGRMKVHWAIRTLNTKDRTEARIRVPGIRLPDLFSTVEESRIWRDMQGDTDKTFAWRGTSVLAFSGNKVFDVHDFPFDRQVVTLQLFEFVWRNSKNTDVYHEAMKVVSFSMETVSMMPEWDTYPAVLMPCNVLHPGSGPTYSTSFVVRLRIERKATYYIMHIFLVSLLICIASALPLAFEPGKAHIGDRLYIHVSGLLSLVAFRNAVASELPSVPYATFISTFMNAQLWTIVAVSIESVFSYLAVDVYHVHKTTLDGFEDVLLVVLLCWWIGFFLYIVYSKEREPWETVMSRKDPTEHESPFSF